MPKYTFQCTSCDNKKQVFTSLKTKTIACEKCQAEMNRQMPVLAGSSEIRETVDSHVGVSWTENQQKLVSDRKQTFYWEIEVPKMVNSGVYSLETMLENRWVYYDDHGNLVTRTKPPQAE